MPLLDLLDTADIAKGAVGGWRYLYSRSYRLQKHREWRDDWLSAFFEVLLGVAGIIVTAGLVAMPVHAFSPFP